MRLPALAVLFFTIFGWASVAHAQSSKTIRTDQPKVDDGQYGREREGWFFYKDPPKPPPKETPPKELKQVSTDPGKPKVLSVEWIRENLPKYRNIAIDNPTKDNVELYLLLQKLAMDKAEQFALASRAYAQQNPGIDETIQNPTSGISRQAITAEQEAQQDSIIKNIAQRAGIYYFFRSDCVYCHRQNPMLDILKRTTNLAVLPISLDGLPSEDGLLPNWRPDQGQGSYLGVEKTPTMYLVEPGGKVLLLSVGVRSLPELKRRIIELAADESWITKKQYDLAMRGLPRRFLTDELDPEKIEDDPEKLLAVLRDASTYGKMESSYADMESVEASPWKSEGTKE